MAGITARRQCESADSNDLQRELERLRQVEQRFKDFADSARDFAFITLDLNNCIIGWNKGAEQLLGYAEAEIIGKPGGIFFTPEDVASGQVQVELEGARSEGRAEDERWHVRKDGTRFWGSGAMTLLREITTGEVHGYAKVMRDRTEQQRYVEALRASEDRFRVLVENVRDCALFQVDLEGKVSDWNPGAERIFGYSANEVMGRSMLELFAAGRDATEVLISDLRRAAEEGGSAADAWLGCKDGSRIYARWITNARHDQTGQLVGYIKVLRNETERKREDERREQQFKHDRALLEGQVDFTSSALDRTREELQQLAGQLLNAQDTERKRIARDLHDHLAQRLGVVEIKLRDLQKDIPRGLHAPQSELEGIQKHVSDLSVEVRDLSHRLHPSTLEHIGLLASMRGLLDEFSAHHTSPVHFDASDFFEEGLSPEIRAVLYRISEEATRNIRLHAGDVPVTVTIYRSPGAVHLEIQDQGPGFSQHALSAKRTLGLVSMAERARLVGGTLEVKSIPGKGTSLQVTVPVLPKSCETASVASAI